MQSVSAASVQVPLAMLTPVQVATVEACAAGPVVITPWRGLVLPGAAGHLPELVAAGFIDDPASPWSAISACVGAPSCQKSLIDTRSYATTLAQSGYPLPRTHISGCERRCGRRPVIIMILWRRRPGWCTTARRGVRVIAPPTRRYHYVTAPEDIYRRSFATIRAETDLSGLPADMRAVAVRMIHACGDIDLVNDLAFHPDWCPRHERRSQAQAVIFTDTQMLAAGITRKRLPADNEVLCLLDDPRTPELAEHWGTTRSAAAVSLWADRLAVPWWR